MADATEPSPHPSPEAKDGATITTTTQAASPPAMVKPPSHSPRKWLILGLVLIGVGFAIYKLIPTIQTAMDTVSTDDAYVNGHVTFVAARVGGQVMKVLVDDNMRVKKGSLLVQLDKEPYQVQVAIKQAAVTAAETDLNAAKAQVRGLMGLVRANRFQLEHAMEMVNSRISDLKSAVATLESKKATADLSKANLKRGEELLPGGGIGKEDVDIRRQTVKVDDAAVDQALQSVYSIRVGLGLPSKPPNGGSLTDTPPNLVEDFSSVRQALGQLLESAAQLGYMPTAWNASPSQAKEEFYKQDPKGNLDAIFAKMLDEAPAIKQADAKLLQARRNLDQANLDLRYCDVVSEIDGVITRRNVNPGNNIQAGQSLMAVRSLTEIWIDANFKETQLADLRIGQPVKCDVDMYGKKREFEGRITGFTMGTGQTLSLLPPQNATGNYVKIVQRLPVRIELTNYDPDKETLFIGLSVIPRVYFKEKATGPHAGEFLQPNQPLSQGPGLSGDVSAPGAKVSEPTDGSKY